MSEDVDDRIRALMAEIDRIAPPPPPFADVMPPTTAIDARIDRARPRWRIVAVALSAVALVGVGVIVLHGRSRHHVATVSPASSDSTSTTPDHESTSSVPTAPTGSAIPFGSATVQPSVAHRGDTIIVTPAGVIQPICTGRIAVVRTADAAHDQVIQLDGSRWQRYDDAPQPTIPACLAPRSADSEEFTVAGDFPLGSYVVCLTASLTDAGCGTVTVVESTGSTTGPPVGTTSATTAPIQAGIVRPYVDPSKCRPDHVATYGLDDGTLRLFAGPFEAPIPIQIIGDPVDGPTKPFAVVERFFGPVTIAAPNVPTVYPNGNGDTAWTLPDGSTAHIRARGITQPELVDIVNRLTPRDRGDAIPGFDYRPSPDNRLQLVAEHLNTHITGHAITLTCTTPTAGQIDISALTGDTVYVYGGVIDRSVPKDVGINHGSVVIIANGYGPGVPTPADVTNADPAVWQTIPTLTLPSITTTTTELTQPVVAGAYRGARIDGEGLHVELFFIGGPLPSPDDPCSVDYVADVQQTRTTVHVDVRGRQPSPPTGMACDAIGYRRTIVVTLDEPLGSRELVAFGAARQPFDGSTLLAPGWLPDGWSLVLDEPIDLDGTAGASRFWSRTWAPPLPAPAGDSCTASTTGLELIEGSTDLVDLYPRETGEVDVGTFDVSGSTATYTTRTDRGIARLSWRTHDHGFVLLASPRCVGDQPPTLADTLRFARALG